MDHFSIPSFTLRYHKYPVSSLETIELNDSKIPYLISGDEKGTVIIWDLLTRRPITISKISEDCIVYIEQIDVDLLAILSRDFTLRFFTVQDHNTGSNKELIVKKENNTRNKVQLLTKPIWEIPINTLNFTNVCIKKIGIDDYRLYCCHTQDSELLDIYKINPRNKILKREVSKISLGDTDKMGIVMKMVRANDDIVYIGTENGYIVGIDSEGKIRFSKKVVYPDPVLDMTLSGDQDYIYVSTTSNMLQKINIKDMNEIALKINVSKCNQIGKICTMNNDYIVCITWKGECIIIDKENKVQKSFSKSRSNQIVSTSNIGGKNNNVMEKFHKNHKMGSLLCIGKQTMNNEESLNSRDQRRIKGLISKDWCLIGFDDGTIAVYDVTMS